LLSWPGISRQIENIGLFGKCAARRQQILCREKFRILGENGDRRDNRGVADSDERRLVGREIISDEINKKETIDKLIFKL
jgi:hypothetical protein